MCNRAEQFARKLYTPWSEDGMSRKDNTEVIEACIKGYEQAEKDTIERACKWMKLHTCTFNNMEEVDLYIDLFRKAMEEE